MVMRDVVLSVSYRGALRISANKFCPHPKGDNEIYGEVEENS